MYGLPYIDEAIECFRAISLLSFACAEEHWNEELILQFFATLHISGYSRDSTTWVLEWMTGDEHYKAPVTELLLLTDLAIPAADLKPNSDEARAELQSLFKQPEPNMTQMLCLMEPLPPNAPLPKKFFV